jgi:hypothetical protein
MVGLAVVFTIGIPDPAGAHRVLEMQGYTNVQTTGRTWFACGRGDLYNTGFVATTPGGDRITGTVCSGILTGSTLRF